jgi:hypothetical protein
MAAFFAVDFKKRGASNLWVRHGSALALLEEFRAF